MQSTNGTYVTFTDGTTHFKKETVERPLDHNDVISFGFNNATVYDVNDENVFIYRLVKEPVQTIDLDSDNEVEPSTAKPTTKDKFIIIDNKVIIDSDSDSNYSGEERFRSMKEMGVDEEGEEEGEEEEDEEDDESGVDSADSTNVISDMETESSSLVVTKILHNCPEPSETISLDDDSSIEADDDDNEPTQSNISKESNSRNDDGDSNIERSDEPSADVKKASDDHKSNESDTKSSENDTTTGTTTKSSESKQTDSKPSPKSSTEIDIYSMPASTSSAAVKNTTKHGFKRSEILKRGMAESTVSNTRKKQKRIRKRRRTITEDDYEEMKERKQDAEAAKQHRRLQLAELGNKDKAKRDAVAEEQNGDSSRVTFVPKVKNATVTRAEQLLTDLLALSNNNPNTNT